jgi:hypothetical protein
LLHPKHACRAAEGFRRYDEIAMSDTLITVYRFRSVGSGPTISPQRMWGTPEAIASLTACEPIPTSARQVHPKLLEEGFFFEQVDSSYIKIEQAEAAPQLFSR